MISLSSSAHGKGPQARVHGFKTLAASSATSGDTSWLEILCDDDNLTLFMDPTLAALLAQAINTAFNVYQRLEENKNAASSAS